MSLVKAPDTAPSARDLGEILEFMRLLWAIEHLLRSTSKRMYRRLGVTGPQRVVLRIVGRFPGITPAELSDLLHLHRSTVTGIVQRLVARRLIVRDEDPHDGRRVRLHVRASARHWGDSPPSASVEAAVRRALNGSSKGEVAGAARVLAAIVKSLKNHVSDDEA